MAFNTPLRMAVVGCGYWGINYVRVLSELPETKLVAICDQDEKRLSEISRRYPTVQAFTDLNDLFSSEECEFDAAVVSTSATSHYDVTRRLLERGKHILVEKPMTTDTSQAAHLVGLARDCDVKLMVGHIFLFNSAIEKIKTYLTQGQLGEPYYLYSQRTNLGPIRHDVNALWDLATHDVSIFNYLLDLVPEWVSAIGACVLHNRRQDVGFIVLGYPNGILGQIHVSWANPHKVRELVIVGSNERIAFNDLDSTAKVQVFEKGVVAITPEPTSFGEYQFSIRDGDIISPHIQLNEPLKKEIQHFVECVLNDQRPLSDGEHGLQVVQVMEAAECSIEQNGTPIYLDKVTA